MKPIPAIDIPSDGFVYEVKYDGFRAILKWTKNDISLISRNNKNLTSNFPEIITFCKANQSLFDKYLPLMFDGELVILNNKYQANFALLQTRGRLKNKINIQNSAKTRPATYMIFDILKIHGNDVTNVSYIDRKKKLQRLLTMLKEIDVKRLTYVPTFENSANIWNIVFAYKGEGIVAKRKTSKYSSGKKHRDWFKIKNWRKIQGFLSSYNPKNSYFTVSVFHNNKIYNIGKCKHGLNQDTSHTLKQLFLTEGNKKDNLFTLPPAICTRIHTLDLHGNELREPEFFQLLPNMSPDECTNEQLKIDLAMFPLRIELSNLDKVFWDEGNLTKGDFLIYMREISPYMLPFLQERALTVIRCPNGIRGETFYQKNLPAYAPSFIKNMQLEDKKVILCDYLDTLIWLANHGAIEYHIPFQTISNQYPTEIAFDLDPPSRKEFKVAIFAAKLIKQILDDLKIVSFIKTSGNKGLQIHIPIPKKSMSYEDTALFTEAIAKTLVNEYPNLFTIERLKKNRKNRLYIDYVQHGKNKTLIAPYSPRKTKEASVATPLYWEEVHEDLTPDSFTIRNVVKRVQTLGCPFTNYSQTGKQQKLDKLWQLIR